MASILDKCRTALRRDVCTACWKRPHGSERLPALEPRSCEGSCQVFVHLERLLIVARETAGMSDLEADKVRRDVVCFSCQEMPSSGEYCLQNLTHSCPLARHAQQVLHTLRATAQPPRPASAVGG